MDGLERGFTAIELLVTTSIFVLISVAMIVNFREGEKLSNLNFGAKNIAQNIRQMQSRAIASKSIPGYGIPQGYGVRFETGNNSRYILFSDKNNDRIYTDSTELLDLGEVKLPSSVVIDSYTPSGARLDIFYGISNGIIFINGSQSDTQASIAVRHTGLGRTKTIFVSQISGLVKIQ